MDNFTRQIVHFVKGKIERPEKVLTVVAYPAMSALEINVVILMKDQSYKRFTAATVEIEDDFSKYVDFVGNIIKEINA